MKKLMLPSLGFFTVLSSICSPSRESSPSKRVQLQGSGSAQAASSSAVAANHGEFDANVNWRDLFRLKKLALKDLFKEFSQALIDCNLQRAELIFDIMDIYKRNKQEAIQLIKLVRPDLPDFDEYDTYIYLINVKYYLDRLMSIFQSNQEARDLIEVAQLDVEYLINLLNPNAIGIANVLNEEDNNLKLAREIRNFEEDLGKKNLRNAAYYYNLIEQLASESKNNKLKKMAADILSRAAGIMKK